MPPQVLHVDPAMCFVEATAVACVVPRGWHCDVLDPTLTPTPTPTPTLSSNPHPYPHPHPHPHQVLPGRVVRTTPARRANTAPGRANTALCFWDFRAAHADYDLRLSPTSRLYGGPLVPGPLTPGPRTPGALAAAGGAPSLSTLTMAREYSFVCWVRLAPTGAAPLRCVAR